MRRGYYNLDPRDSNIYTLKYKKIIDDANQGTRSDAIKIAERIKNEGLLKRNIGITISIIGFISFASCGFLMVRNFSGINGMIPIFISMAFFMLGGFLSQRGSLIIKFSDYINTKDERDAFSNFDVNDEKNYNVFCDKCGAGASMNSSFCKKCGNKL